MVKMEDIGVSLTCRQNTVAPYIENCPIMDLCLAAERKQGMRLSRRWWEQLALAIMGIREGKVVAEGVGRWGVKNRRRRDRESKVGADDGKGMIW